MAPPIWYPAITSITIVVINNAMCVAPGRSPQPSHTSRSSDPIVKCLTLGGVKETFLTFSVDIVDSGGGHGGQLGGPGRPKTSSQADNHHYQLYHHILIVIQVIKYRQHNIGQYSPIQSVVDILDIEFIFRYNLREMLSKQCQKETVTNSWWYSGDVITCALLCWRGNDEAGRWKVQLWYKIWIR